ncbi:hypothetical protein V8C86DRAFT_2560558 [Haematococcus lacustris]
MPRLWFCISVATLSRALRRFRAVSCSSRVTPSRASVTALSTLDRAAAGRQSSFPHSISRYCSARAMFHLRSDPALALEIRDLTSAAERGWTGDTFFDFEEPGGGVSTLRAKSAAQVRSASSASPAACSSACVASKVSQYVARRKQVCADSSCREAACTKRWRIGLMRRCARARLGSEPWRPPIAILISRSSSTSSSSDQCVLHPSSTHFSSSSSHS